MKILSKVRKKLISFYNIVSGQFKKIREILCNSLTLKIKQSNNPQLTKLMETEMTFKELKEKEFELIKTRMDLIAKQSSILYSKTEYGREYTEKDYNDISDKIYQIDDLLKGIKFKISEVGFKYEYAIQILVPNNFNELQLWSSIKTIILEKNYPTIFSDDDLTEFMTLIKIDVGESVKTIRKVL